MRDFANATGTLAKTDTLDAAIFARFRAVFEPKVTVFASDTQQQLQDYVNRRQQLVEILSGEKNRLQQLNGPKRAGLRAGVEEVEVHIEWLQDRIK